MIFPTVCPLPPFSPPRTTIPWPALTPCLLYTAPPEKVARLSSSAKDKAVGGWQVAEMVGGTGGARGTGGCKLKSSPFSRFLFSPMVLNCDGITVPADRRIENLYHLYGTHICVAYFSMIYRIVRDQMCATVQVVTVYWKISDRAVENGNLKKRHSCAYLLSIEIYVLHK